jgi:2-oxoglutarate ferredoxin oxidoreductase subunit beta
MADRTKGSSGKNPILPNGEPAGKKASLPPGDLFSGDGDAHALTRKDFSSGQDVRWCPGCGDYSILAAVQRLLPELGVERENVVFISGIGCSSRFPYYMNTFGFHSIHGRAPTLATGLKASRPDLDVWIVTGDGDALSIGGNHFMHVLRRNVNVQLLLFNNQIYGLTKGQYSPTSEEGKVTKSSPFGSVDHPVNPVNVALGAEASFVARTMDMDPHHLTETLRLAHQHRGSSFVEIYQNCNIFNNGAFFQFTEKNRKPEHALFLEHGKPMVYDNGRKGIHLEGFSMESIDLTGSAWSINDCVVHDDTSIELAHLLGRMFFKPDVPRPFGVIFQEERETYEDLLHNQIQRVIGLRGKGELDKLFRIGDTWEIT